MSDWNVENLPEVDEAKDQPQSDTGTGKKETLLDRAYGMAFNLNDIPPKEESCLYLGNDHPIAARGNLTGIQGQAKVGKSAVVSSILGAVIRTDHGAHGDLLQFDWKEDSRGAIIHFDTEQSPADWHALVRRSLQRSGLPQYCDRLRSFPAVTFTRGERLTLLEGVLEREAERLGAVDAVIIDGIADLCASPNDEGESLELIAKIHSLSHQYNCMIGAVLHENPSSEQGKTRGHLGSELTRKAYANLRIDKAPGNGLSTIYGTNMRKRDLPKNQGFCFAWDDKAMMHTYQGRREGLDIAKKEETKVQKEREFFTPIYASKGTNGSCPVLTVESAYKILREINGTKEIPKKAAFKKQMQRAETLGVLIKTGRGEWKLNTNGTNGT